MGDILATKQFEFIAKEGLGRSHNAIAHSMAAFGDSLYVGATSPSTAGEDTLPRIMAYNLTTREWATVYEPELIETTVRAAVPDVQFAGVESKVTDRLKSRTPEDFMAREFGFRSMLVFKGKSDKAPCLYVATLSRTGGTILRSEDGKTFEIVGEPGFGNDEVLSFRGLTAFKDKVFVAPVGTITNEYIDRNLAPEARIYVSTDPASGKWQDACEIGFGEDGNRAIFSLAATKNYVYAGTGNPVTGMELWRTDAKGKAPYKWEKVLAFGGFRYAQNFATAAMAEFNGALYVGGGITGFGYDKAHDIGPAAAELIRVHDDGSWDLIFGEARFTPDGLKIPLSAMGPGLDDPFNSIVWSMCEHDGVFYIGTHNWEPVEALNKGREIIGGYQLWASKDGEEWEMILSDGCGNPASTGIRTLCSTSIGLAVGTSNHANLMQFLARIKRSKNAFDGSHTGFEVLIGHDPD